MSEYVKIRKQILKDIADVIRIQKNTDRLFKPTEFASIIEKFFTLPADETKSTFFNWYFENYSSGYLPEIQSSFATTTLSGITLFSTIKETVENEE